MSLHRVINPTPIQPLMEKWDKPFFLYDLDRLSQHLNTLTVPDGVSLYYAVKANPLSAIIRTVHQAGLSFDVASMGEMTQVLKQGVGADQLINTGPAKSAEHIEVLLNAGVRCFVAESVGQLALLNELAPEPLDILLRLQVPNHMQKDGAQADPEQSFDPLGMANAFGLTGEEWRKARLTDYPNLNVLGCHCFQWSNLLSAVQLVENWRAIIPHMQALATDMGFPLSIIDMGGGIGVPYEGKKGFDWQQFHTLIEGVKPLLNGAALWLELGRYAVGECGTYFTKIIDRKHNNGQEQLILEGGINHLMRPALSGQPFPVSVVAEEKRRDTEQRFYLYGPLCTGLDGLGSFDLPSTLRPGDWLAFHMTGAYGFTEGMPFFLCHVLPGEATIEAGEIIELRQPEAAESWLR